MLQRSLRKWLALCCIAVLVTACGGGSGGGNSANSSSGGSPSTGNGGTGAPTPTPLSYAVQLQWSPPSTRADGSALPSTELSGYRIFYAHETDSSKDAVVPVTGGLTTSLQITLSAAGTYTFAITALDQSGQESTLSTPVTVLVN